MIFIATLAFAVSTAADAFSDVEAKLTVNMRFTSARALILKNGWKPLQMHVGENYEYDGVEKEYVRSKFLEVDSCSNDSARCILYYKKGDECLRLDTIGEHLKNTKVVRWARECPSH
ncbi:hypothetical protein [Massilia sp. TS11]|uniref:hypothetical protein n=1 Tax=Massilia sp. TS11 TaxID=2908003 RepID=UPI001EDC7D50|nr:hypothetical protein [Massilia sp. TS11]MCG2583063.1 hypothetical protein [Massilia sp. TS11]